MQKPEKSNEKLPSKRVSAFDRAKIMAYDRF
jgi:hypothetical protein